MKTSEKLSSKEFQFAQSSPSSQKKSDSDICAEKLRTEHEEEQRAIKELDEFLKPAIIAAKNGDVVSQTFDEIVEEARKEVLI